MNSDDMCLLEQRTADNATAVETRGCVFCLFMPGRTVTGIRYDFYRILKEPGGQNEGFKGCSYKTTCFYRAIQEETTKLDQTVGVRTAASGILLGLSENTQ